MFPLDEIELPPYLENDLADCPEILWKDPVTGAPTGYARGLEFILKAGGVEFWKRWIQAYLACVAFVDDQVGVIVNALEDNGFLENTIIMLTSDHGWHMGEKDHLSKNTIWEETTRVPLVVVAPGVTAAGTTCVEPVSLVDLYPTLIDLCELPKEPNANGNGYALDGHSLRPLLADPENEQWGGPSVALSCRYGPGDLAVDVPGKPEGQHFSVRSKHWRYTRCSNGDEELYDHRADPHEWHNLAGNPEYEETKRELGIELRKLVPLE
jgi:arylsulfatase A-like enzyme